MGGRGRALLIGAHLAVGLGLVVAALLSDLSTIGRVAGVVIAGALTTGLVGITLRRGVVGRGLAALTGGILGVGFGGGIGPAWLAADGLSIVALAELVALAAGLVLLVAGTWWLVRATPGWWRLAAIPIGFLLLQFVLVPLAGAAYGTHPPRTPLEAPLPQGAQAVTFEATDGVPLEAWYTPPDAAEPAATGAVVVLLPGSGGPKDSTLAHAAVLHARGYGTLALDSRGTGESGGVPNAWGWRGVDDVAGALAWLRTRPEVDGERIALLGLSMGGEIALTASAEDLGLAAVVAEGVSARVPSDLAYLPADLTGIIQRIDGEIMWALADLMSDGPMPRPLTTVTGEGAQRAPILIIVAGDPSEVAAAPLLASAADVRFWHVPDAPHISSLAVHPDEWDTQVTGFLGEALGS